MPPCLRGELPSLAEFPNQPQRTQRSQRPIPPLVFFQFLAVQIHIPPAFETRTFFFSNVFRGETAVPLQLRLRTPLNACKQRAKPTSKNSGIKNLSFSKQKGLKKRFHPTRRTKLTSRTDNFCGDVKFGRLVPRRGIPPQRAGRTDRNIETLMMPIVKNRSLIIQEIVMLAGCLD